MPSPKYFSKNALNFSIMPCFFFDRFPPPKRETGGISLSISVPVVLMAPSRNAFSMNFRVSSGLSFSVAIISAKSDSSCFCLIHTFKNAERVSKVLKTEIAAKFTCGYSVIRDSELFNQFLFTAELDTSINSFADRR